MAEAETRFFKGLDREIKDGLGADTIIVNVVDGALRPAAKRAFKPHP